MEEILPVLLGLAGGLLLWRPAQSPFRHIAISVMVIFGGLAATVLSGEYLESWVYLLLDIGETSAGLALGIIVRWAIGRWRAAQRASST